MKPIGSIATNILLNIKWRDKSQEKAAIMTMWEKGLITGGTVERLIKDRGLKHS